MEKEELLRKVGDKDAELVKYRGERRKLEEKDGMLRKKDAELTRVKTEVKQIRGSLQAEVDKNQNAAREFDRQVVELTKQISNYTSINSKLHEQLTNLEQSNSKAVGDTGAFKDSPAIPPNLEKSVFVVQEAAFVCAKAFFIFLKKQRRSQDLEALSNPEQNSQARVDERFGKYEMEARICNRLFAGFENDSYLDSVDCAQGPGCRLPANSNEITEFFLQNQDMEARHRRYLDEYNGLLKLNLQKILVLLKRYESANNYPFTLFCCRKLTSILISLELRPEEFRLSENEYFKDFLLYYLAMNPNYCDTLLKPFVSLALATFLLHRLAFQFQTPPRIFRYVPGTRYDPKYMQNAFSFDDDEANEELVVNLMLVPGFQVGATIVKCTVYLVPSRAMFPQDSGPSK